MTSDGGIEPEDQNNVPIFNNFPRNQPPLFNTILGKYIKDNLFKKIEASNDLHLLHVICSLQGTDLKSEPGQDRPRYFGFGLSQYRLNGMIPPSPHGCVQKSDLIHSPHSPWTV